MLEKVRQTFFLCPALIRILIQKGTSPSIGELKVANSELSDAVEYRRPQEDVAPLSNMVFLSKKYSNSSGMNPIQ